MPVDRQKIAALRQARMLTMPEAAKRAGMGTRQQWWGIETGQRDNISADTLYAVARALGVTMDSLMVQDVEPPGPGGRRVQDRGEKPRPAAKRRGGRTRGG